MKISKHEAEEIYFNNNFIISEKSSYQDDTWELDGSDKKLCFSMFNARPEMKSVIKNYLIYKYIQNSGNSVLRTFCGVKKFYKYINDNYEWVTSFDQVNRIMILSYFHYILSFKFIRGEKGYNDLGKTYSTTEVIHSTFFLKDLYIEGIRKGIIDKDPSFGYEIEKLFQSEISQNPRMIKKARPRTTKNHYQEETLNKIVQCALDDRDLYARAMIIIQTQTGARVNEVLSLEEDCIFYVNGRPRIKYITTKTKLGKVLVDKPINELVIRVVNDLVKFTEPIRIAMNTKKIFVVIHNPNAMPRNFKEMKEGLSPNCSYCFISKTNVNRDFYKPFIIRNDIRENKDTIEYSSHYNRHFFAALSWRANMSVHSIKSMLNHDSLVMTSSYTEILECEMRNKFKAMMSSPNGIVGVRSEEVKKRISTKNVFEGRTEEQLEAIIGVMNIQVLSNGACIHHPLKAEQRLEKCKPGCLTCERFISHNAYVEVHERRVAKLEAILENAKSNENTMWYLKNKAEKEFIEDTYIKPFK